MQMLSDDDLNLREMTREELDAAWDLWFDLAQATNDRDPPFTHGVFAGPELAIKTIQEARAPREIDVVVNGWKNSSASCPPDDGRPNRMPR
jgi:hypothetical protein